MYIVNELIISATWQMALWDLKMTFVELNDDGTHNYLSRIWMPAASTPAFHTRLELRFSLYIFCSNLVLAKSSSFSTSSAHFCCRSATHSQYSQAGLTDGSFFRLASYIFQNFIEKCLNILLFSQWNVSQKYQRNLYANLGR